MAQHAKFHSKETYPRLYLLDASFRRKNEAFAALFKRYNWKRAALIYGIDIRNPTQETEIDVCKSLPSGHWTVKRRLEKIFKTSLTSCLFGVLCPLVNNPVLSVLEGNSKKILAGGTVRALARAVGDYGSMVLVLSSQSC